MVNIVKRDEQLDMHPPPLHQPGLILPSWWNVRQKAAVATLCVLCAYARKRPLPLCVYSLCTPESGRCHSACTLCEPTRRRRREHSPKIKWPNPLNRKIKAKQSLEKTKCRVFLFLHVRARVQSYSYLKKYVNCTGSKCIPALCKFLREGCRSGDSNQGLKMYQKKTFLKNMKNKVMKW